MKRELVFNRHGISQFEKMKKWIDSGDGCPKYDALNATDLYILPWLKWKFSVMCILPQLKFLKRHNIGRICCEEAMVPLLIPIPRHTRAFGVI